MFSRLPRRLTPWLIVFALATPQPAAALPLQKAGALWAALCAALSAFWEANLPPAPAAAPKANSCEADPSGACTTVLRDNGCQLDPDGACAN